MIRFLVWPALLLLSFDARAQRPEIIGFADSGVLTWTNGIPGGYYSVECRNDLRFMWYPITTGTWNQAAFSAAGSCQLDLSIFDEIDIPIPSISALMRRAFFRLIVSTNPIPMPAVLHRIHVVNQSSAPLSNIVVSSISHWQHTEVTNIPSLDPSQTSNWVDVSVPYVFGATGVVSGSTTVDLSDGWRLAYQQDSTSRSLLNPMLVLGPTNMEIVELVSNTSISTVWTWLNMTNTRAW